MTRRLSIATMIDAIMNGRSDLPLPLSIAHCVWFLLTEWAELADATLRQNDYYRRNNARAHTPAEELGDSHHMLMITIKMLRDAGATSEYKPRRLRVYGDPTVHHFAIMQQIAAVGIRLGRGDDKDHICNDAYRIHDHMIAYARQWHNLSLDDIHNGVVKKLLDKRRPVRPDTSIDHDYGRCAMPDCNHPATKRVGAVFMCIDHHREVCQHDR